MVLDQFYTKDEIAEKYYNIVKTFVDLNDYDIILEPSAGKGAFYKLFPEDKRVGLDLEPKYNGIQEKDYFDYIIDNDKKYIVIGNPPFGKISSIAVKFFNKSAEFADIIAFILPRTFKRVSIQNQLSLNFKLIFNDDLPLKPCCFEPIMNAKCSFQIWKKDIINLREMIVYDIEHKDFNFIKLGEKDKNNQPTPPKNADFVIKAYGSNCGEIVDKDLHKLRPKSWHWIKSNIDINILKKNIKSLDYSISKDTVRQDSIGQKELIYLYKIKFG